MKLALESATLEKPLTLSADLTFDEKAAILNKHLPSSRLIRLNLSKSLANVKKEKAIEHLKLVLNHQRTSFP